MAEVDGDQTLVVCTPAALHGLAREDELVGKLVDGQLVGSLAFVEPSDGFFVQDIAFRPIHGKDAHLIHPAPEAGQDLCGGSVNAR